MSFLFNKNNHFNLANIVTFFNIASGIFAIYFRTVSGVGRNLIPGYDGRIYYLLPR